MQEWLDGRLVDFNVFETPDPHEVVEHMRSTDATEDEYVKAYRAAVDPFVKRAEVDDDIFLEALTGWRSLLASKPSSRSSRATSSAPWSSWPRTGAPIARCASCRH